MIDERLAAAAAASAKQGLKQILLRPKVISTIVALLAILIFWSQAFVFLDAGKILVVQVPISGKLLVSTEPGTHMLLSGTYELYPKRTQYSFSSAKDQGKKDIDESLKVRFNDGGHANVSGVISWEMPLDEPNIVKLHTKYRSYNAIEQQLVRPTIERAMYLTSPHMSSTESYAERRSEFLQLFEDQVRNGVYQTHTISRKEKDPITGADKTVQIVQIAMKDGVQLREGESPFKEFGVQVLPPTINDIKYDDDVEKQIKAQRDAVMSVQTAKADALAAEQRALTVEKKGQADAADAKWKQEAIKAQKVTEAEQEKQVAQTNAEKDKAVAETAAAQRKAVADLDMQAADSKKKEQILLGQGEAERKKLVLAADGALEQKLRAYTEVMGHYATAMAAYKGNWVPSVVMAGNNGQGGTSANGAQDLIGLLTAKTAKDLSIDLSLPTGANATRQ